MPAYAPKTKQKKSSKPKSSGRKQGKRDEDHLAAIMFNAMALIHYEEMIERGILPAELSDMPAYAPKTRQKKSSKPKGSSRKRGMRVAR